MTSVTSKSDFSIKIINKIKIKISLKLDISFVWSLYNNGLESRELHSEKRGLNEYNNNA